MTPPNFEHAEDVYRRVDEVVAFMMRNQPGPETLEARLLVALCDYMHDYERIHASLPSCTPDPVDVIEFQLDRFGWTRSELARRAQIQPTHLSSVLSRKRTLSLNQAKKLAALFDIPLDRLVENEFKTQIVPVESGSSSGL